MDKVTKVVEMRNTLKELVTETLNENLFDEAEHFYTMLKIVHALYTRYHSGRPTEGKSSIIS